MIFLNPKDWKLSIKYQDKAIKDIAQYKYN